MPDLAYASLSLSQRQFGPSNGGPVNLHGVDLEGAMLRFATLTAASLEGARLVGTDLMHARLDRANLANADLTDAILEHTDLTGTRLDGATLVGASLQNARNLRQPQVDAAHGDASTFLPLGLVAPPRWFPAASPEEFLGCPIPEEVREDELDSDPYRLLGVAPNASADEIREAYRKLVKVLHPDLNPGNREAAIKFRKVNEAYNSLKSGQGTVKPSVYNAEPYSGRGKYEIAAAIVLFLAIGGGVFYWLETTPRTSQITLQDSAGNETPEQPVVAEAPPPEATATASAEQQNAEPLNPETPKVETAEPEARSDEAEPPAEAKVEAAPEATPQPQPDAPLLANARDTPQPEIDTSSSPEVVRLPTASLDTRSAHSQPAKALPSRAGSELLSARGEPHVNTPPVSSAPPTSTPVRVAVWEEEWQNLHDSHDIAALYGFIRRHPGELAAADARTRYHTVLAGLTSSTELASFVKKHGGHDNPEISAAKQRLASLVDGDAELKAWEAAEKANTRAAYESYLRAYKNGPHAAEASEKIAAIREAYRQRDAAAWAKAELENTRNAYAAYLTAHPRGYHVKKAQARLGASGQAQERPKPASRTTVPTLNN